MLKMKRLTRMIACLLAGLMLFASCGNAGTETETADDTESETDTETESETESETVEEEKTIWDFDGSISEETLRAYLSRAVTMSAYDGVLRLSKTYEKDFILDVGAKYICRAATCWNPSSADYSTYSDQKNFINSVHKKDPDVIFEACIFECVSRTGVESIPIPAKIFEAFGLEPEERNFDYDAMIFRNGSYVDQWATDASVPDITRIETQMFFYYRAIKYIDTGYEALHMGQVKLIGSRDTNWECYTRLNTMIRDYAKEHARRHFVLLNAHAYDIIDANGYLMFDFHMYPSRLVTGIMTTDGEMDAYVMAGYSDSIYNRSRGGMTYSGWECDSLPYLVELDNFDITSTPGTQPDGDKYHVWGYDEISWFANQSDEYRRFFISNIIDEVRSIDSNGYFAFAAERIASIYDEDGKVVSYMYYAYDKDDLKSGFGDQAAIKAAFAARDIGD